MVGLELGVRAGEHGRVRARNRSRWTWLGSGLVVGVHGRDSGHGQG